MILLHPPHEIALGDCVLRGWSVTDAAALRAALTASEAHLRAWTPWVVDGRVPGLSLEERLVRHAIDFSSGTEWVYGLFAANGVDVLGSCGLYPRVGPHAVEIGYWLSVGQTGRGLATRAAAALTRVAFESDDVDQVDIRCERRNVASARVPERLGYQAVETVVEGTADLVIWRLTRAELARQSWV